MHSRFPSGPVCSGVVAFALTMPTSHPMASAILRRILSIYGASFGSWAITDYSLGGVINQKLTTEEDIELFPLSSASAERRSTVLPPRLMISLSLPMRREAPAASSIPVTFIRDLP